MDNGDDAPLVSAVHFTAEKGGDGMLTNNGLTRLYYVMSGNSTQAPYKLTDGSEIRSSAYTLNVMVSSMEAINDRSKYAILIGSDDTPATPDDYKWEHNITSQVSVTSYSNALLADKTTCISMSCVNSTDTDIEVKEIGLIAGINSGSKVLLAREVFNEPVIIKANGGAQTFGLRIG